MNAFVLEWMSSLFKKKTLKYYYLILMYACVLCINFVHLDLDIMIWSGGMVWLFGGVLIFFIMFYKKHHYYFFVLKIFSSSLPFLLK